MKSLFAILLIIFSVAQICAQIPERNIQAVSVTGMAVGHEQVLSVTALDSASLELSAFSSFSELLSRHSTIYIKSYGGGSQATVSFRGSAASHTQVDWNGIPINNPMLGQVDFSLLPVWLTDRVDIYHGGSSLGLGSGGLGGAIHIGSAPLWGRSFYGSLMQSGGSFGSYTGAGMVGGGNSSVQIRTRYIFDRADNRYSFLNTDRVPRERMKQTNAGYKRHGSVTDLFWNAGRGNAISASFWYMDNESDIPPLASNEGPRLKEYRTDRQLRTVVKWSTYGKSLKTEVHGGYSHENLHYYNALLGTSGEVSNLISDSRSFTDSFYGRAGLSGTICGRTDLRLNLDAAYHDVFIRYLHSKTVAENLYSGYGATRTEAGLTAKAEHRFPAMFTLYGLLREELFDGNFSSPLFSTGMQYRVSSEREIFLSVNIARNHHRPTLNDLYWVPGGNPDLVPEKSMTGDFSFCARGESGTASGSLSVTGFYSRVKDWIIWIPGNYYYWTAENLRKVHSRGLEFSARGKISAGPVTVTAGGNYAWVRSTNEKSMSSDDMSVGKQLIYVPRHKGNTHLGAEYGQFSATLVSTYVGRRYTTTDNLYFGKDLPFYDIHDLVITFVPGFGFAGMTLRLDIQNLFDRDYQAVRSRPMPGRNYRVGIKINF